jgi:hypothetical protein
VQNSSGIHRRLLGSLRCTTLGGADHPALPKGVGAYVERHAKQGDVGWERRSSCAVRPGVRVLALVLGVAKAISRYRNAYSRGVVGMRKIVLPVALAALVVLLSLGLSGSKSRDAEALTTTPNIVFILADDMRYDDLQFMPQTK